MWFMGVECFYFGRLVYSPVIIELAGEEPNPPSASESYAQVYGVADTKVYEQDEASYSQAPDTRDGGGAGEAPIELVITPLLLKLQMWRQNDDRGHERRSVGTVRPKRVDGED